MELLVLPEVPEPQGRLAEHTAHQEPQEVLAQREPPVKLMELLGHPGRLLQVEQVRLQDIQDLLGHLVQQELLHQADLLAQVEQLGQLDRLGLLVLLGLLERTVDNISLPP